MEQETTADYQSRTNKIYKEREIWVGTILGGTLAAGYMVAANYKAFGETGKIWKTWLATAAGTAFLFYTAFFAPYLDRVPNQLFSLICVGIIFVLVQIFQGRQIRTHINEGGSIQSWWKTIGAAFAALGITLILMVGMIYLVTAFEESSVASKSYGKMQSVIYYDRSNISESEVDRIAEAAISTNLFLDSAGKWYVHARKINNDYEISLSVNHATLSDEGYLKFLKEERGYMQAHFPNNKIIINLVEGDFNRIEKRIE